LPQRLHPAREARTRLIRSSAQMGTVLGAREVQGRTHDQPTDALHYYLPRVDRSDQARSSLPCLASSLSSANCWRSCWLSVSAHEDVRATSLARRSLVRGFRFPECYSIWALPERASGAGCL
jgi:hypothetical protein